MVLYSLLNINVKMFAFEKSYCHLSSIFQCILKKKKKMSSGFKKSSFLFFLIL